MAKTATIHARMDEDVKFEALEVLDKMGISVSDAIVMYFKQIALKNGIPFELTALKKPRSNFERVSDFKKDDLQSVLDVLPDSVDELWLFGSSVTKYCRPDSDLDVLVVGDNIAEDDLRTIFNAPRHAIDLLNITHKEYIKQREIKGTVYNEAYTKGLLIYKKGVGLVNE